MTEKPRTTFSPEQIAALRADVAAGAGHECSEWQEDGKCQLCDRPFPTYTCPRCGAVSYHPRDIAEKYCGRCHEFQEL